MSSRIAFLGGGNMADALLQGLLQSGVAEASRVIVAEPVAARREYLEKKHGVSTTGENEVAVRDADVLIVAVKPQVIDEALASVRGALPASALVVSTRMQHAGTPHPLPAGMRYARPLWSSP